jgi:hypothetical protein
MYMGLMMLGRLKYVQLSCYYLSLALLRLEFLLKSGKVNNYQVQVLAELIEAGGNTLCSEIHRFINHILNKEELPEQ